MSAPVLLPEDLEPLYWAIFLHSASFFLALVASPATEKATPSCNRPPPLKVKGKVHLAAGLPAALYIQPHLSPVSPFHRSALTLSASG